MNNEQTGNIDNDMAAKMRNAFAEHEEKLRAQTVQNISRKLDKEIDSSVEEVLSEMFNKLTDIASGLEKVRAENNELREALETIKMDQVNKLSEEVSSLTDEMRKEAEQKEKVKEETRWSMLRNGLLTVAGVGVTVVAYIKRKELYAMATRATA